MGTLPLRYWPRPVVVATCEKKLLKSEQAKSTSRKTRAQDAAASPAASRFASPVIVEEEKDARIDHGTSFALGRRSSKVTNVFFTNTTFYAMMRLLEVRLY